jgi:hypothetical protein
MDLLGALKYIPAFFKSWAITLTGSRLIVHLEPPRCGAVMVLLIRRTPSLYETIFGRMYEKYISVACKLAA